MRPLATKLLFVVLGFAATQTALAKCGDVAGDAAAVAAARAQVASDCNCAGAPKHGEYVRCAAAVATLRAAQGILPPQCKGAGRQCAARSTCGRPGAVTCCRTGPTGVTKCSIKSSAASCTAPNGGAACVGPFPSCCDACTGTGCVTTTTTTTSTTTTSTSPTPCGSTFPACNGSCGPGAQCWPEEFPGIGCQCLPGGVTPCIGSQYPECGGTCPAGGACQATTLTSGGMTLALCACVASGSACVPGAPTATCPGECPVSHSCGIDAMFPGECFCQPASPCGGGSPFPTCNGSCPAGSACAPFRLGTIFSNCVCVPAAVPCDATCGGGVCPAGSACTFLLSAGVPTCACQALP